MHSLWQDLSVCTKNFDLVTLTLTFDLLLKKKLNLGYKLLNQKRSGFHITHVGSLWQELSVCTKKFDIVTLTLTFDLLLKNLTLATTFEPHEIGLLYFTCVFLLARPSCWNQNSLPRDLDLNLDHNFWTKSDRDLILHTSIPYDKTFQLIPIFWPSGFDLISDLLLEKLEFVATGGISPVRTDPDLVEKSVMRTRALPFQQLVIFSITMQEEVSHHIKITFMTYALSCTTFYWPLIYFVILCVILFFERKYFLDQLKPEPFSTIENVLPLHWKGCGLKGCH